VLANFSTTELEARLGDLGGGGTGGGEPILLPPGRVVVRKVPAGIENLLAGRVHEHDEAGGVTRVALGDALVAAPLALSRPLGSPVTLAVPAEDVLISVAPVRGLSARNVYPATVSDSTRIGPDVLLRCRLVSSAISPWLVRVTPAAVEALGIVPGAHVWLAVKSHSVRLL